MKCSMLLPRRRPKNCTKTNNYSKKLKKGSRKSKKSKDCVLNRSNDTKKKDAMKNCRRRSIV